MVGTQHRIDSTNRASSWKLWVWIAVVALASIALVFVLFGLGRNRGVDLGAGGVAVRVRFRDMAVPIRATGVIRAQVGAEVRVGARISGMVETLEVNVGDRVERGAVIAVLEHRDLLAREAQVKADLKAAEAQLRIVRRGARTEEVEKAQAAVDETAALVRYAQAEVDRRRNLVEGGYMSKEEVDRAERDLSVTSARHEMAQAEAQLKRQPYLPEELDHARARVEQARAVLEQIRTQMGYATIKAPIDGVVASVSTQRGETVAVGLNSPTFVTIIDLDRLQVDTYVDEVDIGRVEVGRRATFTVDTYPDQSFDGIVESIYPDAILQDNVVNYVAALSIEAVEASLRPGMTANVTISTNDGRKALAVPSRVIRHESSGPYVLVLPTKEGEPERRTVRLGRRHQGYVEILSGLEEGEQVVPPQPQE